MGQNNLLEDMISTTTDGVPLPLKEFILTSESSFLDIGSGFGAVVWHTFAVANCEAAGHELV
jgi:hypothetical protein